MGPTLTSRISKPYQYGEFIGSPTKGETRILRHPMLKDKPLLSTNALNLTTIYDAFDYSMQHFPNKNFLGTRNKIDENKYGDYQWKSYKEVECLVRQFCQGITKNDFCPEISNGDSKYKFLGIYSKNREEWVVADFACQLNSITVVTMYDTLGLNGLEYIFNQTQLTSILLESTGLSKLAKLKMEGRTGALQNLIILDNTDQASLLKCKEAGLNVYSYEQILKDGMEYKMEKFNKATGDTIMTFCYTSGTTGNPKGAMIPNKALMVAMHDMINIGYILNDTDVYLSYLPLAHIMEQLIFCACVYAACAVGFYSGTPTRLSEDAIALKPTFFCGVPRVFSKLYEVLMDKINKTTGIAKRLAMTAIKGKLADYEKYGKLTHPIYDAILFNKTKAALGGNLRWMLVGSAPIPPDILKFLRIAFCCPIVEGYGQTEDCAGVIIAHESDNSAGHIGGPTPGCEIKLVDVPELGYRSTDINPVTSINEPRGEICVRGPLVFKGYYKDEEKTKEALDADEWLHSGDIGVFLTNHGNAVKIIDRVKNIFKLSQGEYIAPEKIEQTLGRSRYVSQIWVYGEPLQSYIIAVVSPEKETCVNFLKKIGIDATMENVGEYYNHAELKTEIVNDLETVGRKNDLKGFELVKKVHLITEPFSVENNLLTPTMKVKSNEAKKRYKEILDVMYCK